MTCGGFFTALSKYRRDTVLDFPITLMRRSVEDVLSKNGFKYPKEFSQCRIVWFAWFSLNVFLCTILGPSKLIAIEAQKPTKSFVNQNRITASIRPRASSESPMLAADVRV